MQFYDRDTKETSVADTGRPLREKELNRQMGKESVVTNDDKTAKLNDSNYSRGSAGSKNIKDV